MRPPDQVKRNRNLEYQPLANSVSQRVLDSQKQPIDLSNCIIVNGKIYTNPIPIGKGGSSQVFRVNEYVKFCSKTYYFSVKVTI